MQTPLHRLNIRQFHEGADKMGLMAAGLLGSKMRPKGVDYATAQMLINKTYVS